MAKSAPKTPTPQMVLNASKNFDSTQDQFNNAVTAILKKQDTILSNQQKQVALTAHINKQMKHIGSQMNFMVRTADLIKSKCEKGFAIQEKLESEMQKVCTLQNSISIAFAAFRSDLESSKPDNSFQKCVENLTRLRLSNEELLKCIEALTAAMIEQITALKTAFEEIGKVDVCEKLPTRLYWAFGQLDSEGDATSTGSLGSKSSRSSNSSSSGSSKSIDSTNKDKVQQTTKTEQEKQTEKVNEHMKQKPKEETGGEQKQDSISERDKETKIETTADPTSKKHDTKKESPKTAEESQTKKDEEKK